VVGHLLYLLAREASHSQSASGSVGPVPIVSREAIRSRKGAFVMKVGVVGLGHMGSGMAASLLKAGHEVIVYNRTRAKAEPLIAQGARVVASVADACRESVVITMLAIDDAVEGLVLGKCH
jgi:phosphoglycerate dehydrogenase-like enzyme